MGCLDSIPTPAPRANNKPAVKKPAARAAGRGLHSSTSQLNLSRF